MRQGLECKQTFGQVVWEGIREVATCELCRTEEATTERGSTAEGHEGGGSAVEGSFACQEKEAQKGCSTAGKGEETGEKI